MFKLTDGYTKDALIKMIENEFKGKSCEQGGFCYYRHPDKVRKCPVGLFIPDDVYLKGFEGTPLIDIWSQIEEHMPLHYDGMLALQDEHDRSSCTSDVFKMMLVNFIKDNVE